MTGAAAVRGVGTTSFGRAPHRRIEELAWEAAVEALRDATVGPQQVDAVFVGTVFGPAGLAARIVRGLGLGSIPVVNLEAACASGTWAFHEAVRTVERGEADVALAIGVEQLSTQFSGSITPESTDAEGAAGLVLPALYALQARRYLSVYPNTRVDHLAAVAVKNKANGMLNPRAQLRTAPSLADVMESRMIADPLTLLQCCPLTDGAAAAVVGRSADDGSGVRVEASVAVTGGLWDHRSDEPWGVACVARARRKLDEIVDVDLEHIDVLEVHDAFTIGEILALESIGLCQPGEGASLALDGYTALGGRQPVNPSGGLLSRGHPLGATGLAQVAEIVWQIRGTAGERQVPGARRGLVETMGGGASGVDGNACVMAILEAA